LEKGYRTYLRMEIGTVSFPCTEVMCFLLVIFSASVSLFFTADN
jgi:hypothetical protein